MNDRNNDDDSKFDAMEPNREIQVVPAGALAQINRSEIELIIEAAQRHPRSIKEFRSGVRSQAELNESAASECSYTLKRRDAQGREKLIVGPSARFAEIVMSEWKYAEAGGRIIDDRGQFVVAQGVFRDYQKMIRWTVEVQRRVVDKNGRRYSDDMVGVTAMAAISIAMRNAILKGIPKALWNDLWERSRQVAVGDVTTLSNKRLEVLKRLTAYGVSEEMVLQKLERASFNDITVDDVALLIGMITSLKEGEVTPEEMFSESTTDKATGEIRPSSGAEKLAAAMRAKAAGGNGKIPTLGPILTDGGAGDQRVSTTGGNADGMGRHIPGTPTTEEIIGNEARRLSPEVMRAQQREAVERANRRKAETTAAPPPPPPPPERRTPPPLSEIAGAKKKVTAPPPPPPPPVNDNDGPTDADDDGSTLTLTYADIAQAINEAHSLEDLVMCGKVIAAHPDPQQAHELSALLDYRRGQLG